MKKWLISLMMILCVFSFTACGSAAGEDAAASEVTEEIEQKLLDAGVYTVQSIQTAVESGEEIQIVPDFDLQVEESRSRSRMTVTQSTSILTVRTMTRKRSWMWIRR